MKQQSTLSGIILMILAMAVLPGLDACAKWLGATLPASQVTAARFSMQMALLIPVMMLLRLRFDRSYLSLAQMLRGICLAGATWLFFISLKTLPMAEAISIFFVEPLLLTLLGALFLGEVIRIRRIAAIIIGFGGAMLIIQPSFAIFGWPALLPLGAAFFFAGYMIITRILAQKQHPVTAQLSMSFFALMTIIILAFVNDSFAFETQSWQMPNRTEFMIIALLGIIATSGHLMIVFALQRADTGLLAPFQYLEIVNASLLGFIIFSDIPKDTTIIGAAIIIGSGLYLIHRENKAQKTRQLADL